MQNAGIIVPVFCILKSEGKIVVDKIFILNIYKIFLTVRFKIDNPITRELIQLLRDNLLNGGQNDAFINELSKSTILKERTDYDIYLSKEKNIDFDIDPKFVRLYIYILNRLLRLLEEHEYEQSFDIIDTFHWLPESIARMYKIDYVDFFSTYVMPLEKKWGNALIRDVYKLLPVKGFTRARIWIVMMHGRQN